MRKSYRCLLKMEVYELTSTEIGILKKTYGNDSYVLRKILPSYCITKNNKVSDTEHQHQYTSSGTDKHILFLADTVDALLAEEIAQAGLPEILNKYDITPYLKYFKKHGPDRIDRNGILSAEYLILQFDYLGGDWYSDGDWDLDITIVGALVGDELKYVKQLLLDGKYNNNRISTTNVLDSTL